MTMFPRFSQVTGQTSAGQPFQNYEVRLPLEPPGDSLPSKVVSMALLLGDELNGEAATAGFSIALPDGMFVMCWVSAKIIDGRVQVRSWTEGTTKGKLPVEHVIDNPNPHWFTD